MCIKYLFVSLLLCLLLTLQSYAEQSINTDKSKPSEYAQKQCTKSNQKQSRLVREPVPEHLKYIERPKEFKPLDDRILGDIQNNQCIPVKEFKGDKASGSLVVFDTMQQCEELRKKVTTIETEDNLTLSCRFGRKPYRCCDHIPWNPYCVTTCATGCAWNRATASADCVFSCSGSDSCLRYGNDARRKCAWD